MVETFFLKYDLVSYVRVRNCTIWYDSTPYGPYGSLSPYDLGPYGPDDLDPYGHDDLGPYGSKKTGQ